MKSVDDKLRSLEECKAIIEELLKANAPWVNSEGTMRVDMKFDIDDWAERASNLIAK